MKQTVKAALSLLLIVSILISLAGCFTDTLGKKIADDIVDNFVDRNDPAPTKDPNGNPNGEILYETILIEDALHEEILNEDVLRESIVQEIISSEYYLQDDVILEDVIVQVFADVDDLDNDFICESNYSTELDYTFIKQRLASGIGMVLVEVIIDVGSCILDICTQNWLGLAIDAGQIVVTVGSTTLAAFVGYQVAKAKSLAAGNTYEEAIYDALDSASHGYYYTSVVCDVINTAVSVCQAVKSSFEIAKSIKTLINATKVGTELLDATGTAVAKIIGNDTVEVSLAGKKVSCRMAKDSTDLYDIATKQYVGSLVQEGSSWSLIQKTIPDKIYSTRGRLKYIVEDGFIFNVTETETGEIIKTTKSTTRLAVVDPGGFVKNEFGQIIDRIDFATGVSIDGYRGFAKIAPNVSVDVFGDLIDLNTQAKLTKAIVEGETVYLDSTGMKIAKTYSGADGGEYLKRISDVDNGKTIGKLAADGSFESSWKVELNQIRYQATQKFRAGLVQFVENHSLTEIRNTFPELTLEQIDYIKSIHKVPSSLQIHHDLNVANYPDRAGDLTNLEVLSRENHLKAHHGNFQNATTSRSDNWIDVTRFPEFN